MLDAEAEQELYFYPALLSLNILSAEQIKQIFQIQTVKSVVHLMLISFILQTICFPPVP